MWNGKHAANELAFGKQPLPFGLSVQNEIGPDDKVLELGCGMGGDARLFASLGADVVATDFSDVAVAENNKNGTPPNLSFQVLDITGHFPFEHGTFTVLYSHLALHYWNRETTAEVFAEIARVLKPGGKLFFMCKSEKDPKYGQGGEVEPGVFSRNGHIRHFFSPEYTRALLAKDFEIIKLEESAATYAGEDSAFVECWAVRK